MREQQLLLLLLLQTGQPTMVRTATEMHQQHKAQAATQGSSMLVRALGQGKMATPGPDSRSTHLATEVGPRTGTGIGIGAEVGNLIVLIRTGVGIVMIGAGTEGTMTGDMMADQGTNTAALSGVGIATLSGTATSGSGSVMVVLEVVPLALVAMAAQRGMMPGMNGAGVEVTGMTVVAGMPEGGCIGGSSDFRAFVLIVFWFKLPVATQPCLLAWRTETIPHSSHTADIGLPYKCGAEEILAAVSLLMEHIVLHTAFLYAGRCDCYL